MIGVSRSKWATLAVSAFISGLVFLYLPSEIYVRNPVEFISTPALLIKELLLWWAIATVLLTLPSFVPHSTGQRIWQIILSSLAIALWVSGVFLVPDLGSMDGASFDLGRHDKILAIHTILFAAVLAGAVLLMRKWPAYLMSGLAIIGIGLAANTVTNFYTAGASQDGLYETVDPSEVARFSLDRNVLILVFDTFQSDILQVIAEQQPSTSEFLDGFEFFPDTLGVAPTTYLTMPAFHSGVSYDRLASLPHYYDQGVRQDSFLGELAKNHYQVDIVNPIASVCPQNINTCEHQENLLLNSRQVTDNEAFRLADLGIFRATPGQLKKWVFDGSSGLISRTFNENPLTGLEHRIYNANSVLKMIADNINTDDGPPTAKLVHLLNTHPPFMFDAECEFTGISKVIDRHHQTEQTKCAMRWFTYLLDTLKKSGVYDNSLIILTADTGAGSLYANDDLSSLYAQDHGVSPGELGRLIGGANPVLAIKLPESRGAMRTSKVQAQLTDIPRTVCESLGDCSNNLGLNLGRDQNEIRERIYQYYQFKHEYWGLDYIPGITQYSVVGPLWLESSWTQSETDAPPQEVLRLDFSAADDPRMFGAGWSAVEVENEAVSKRWATASEAELFLPIPEGKSVVLAFKALRTPGLEGQQVVLSIDDQVIVTRPIREGLSEIHMPVPGSLVSGPETRILLEFSNLKSPENNEHRELAAAFFSLVVYQR